MMKEYVIVGAGISGLTAALAIKKKQRSAKVLLVDAANEPGGLLRSHQFGGMVFDLGTHIPELTENSDLNKLIFPDNIIEKWHILSELNVGNFFSGKLNNESQFLNLTETHPIFHQALNELLKINIADLTNYKNLQDSLTALYGVSLTEQVLKPLILKMTDTHPKDLTPQAIIYYGLSRIAIGNRQQALNLKKIPNLDRVLAYTQDKEKPRQSTWIYPGHKGVGEWVNFMYKSCITQGVEFRMQQRVNTVTTSDLGYRLETSHDDFIDTKHLIWTLPFYNSLQGGEHTRYQTRSIAIYHFISQAAPKTDRHYIYCQQADMHSYRLTLYDNISPKQDNRPYRISVEVIFDGVAPNEGSIRREMTQMGLFDHPKAVALAGINKIPYGFPIPKVESQQHQRALFSQVQSNYPNVIFAGRGKPGLFFTSDVLLDIYSNINSLIAAKE